MTYFYKDSLPLFHLHIGRDISFCHIHHMSNLHTSHLKQALFLHPSFGRVLDSFEDGRYSLQEGKTGET